MLVGEFNYHLGLAVVTLSKSFYPHCSSVPSCIANRDLASARDDKNFGQKHQSH